MPDKEPYSLVGKQIVVTGASSGIGRACAVAFAQQGATLSLFGRDNNRLNETLELMVSPTTHLAVSVDLTDYDKVAEAVEHVVSLKGPVSGIVNCAGISATLPLNVTTEVKMEHFLRTNVVGPANITRLFLKKSNFSPVGGSVVFLSSVMGVAGEKGKTVYSMTKGAMLSAVRSMAVELASRGIRVNAVSPGVVKTPMSEGAVYSRDEEALNRIVSLHPLGLGDPGDVANACLFLISDASKWITGINLVVDGGYLAK